jgi:hypothetical protein
MMIARIRGASVVAPAIEGLIGGGQLHAGLLARAAEN